MARVGVEAFVASILIVTAPSRSTTSAPGPEVAAAKRIAAGSVARPSGRPHVIAGEGWGCAHLPGRWVSAWQCWEAGPAPHAWIVPWIEPGQVAAGPDRVCVVSAAEPSVFRCWRRPRRGDRVSQPLLDDWQWLNPHHVHLTETFQEDPVFGSSLMGGTFACLGGRDAIFCRGDDRFGQLGICGPDTRDGPACAPVRLSSMRSAGTWHACAVERRPRGDEVVCWGRDDYGQLGGPARDACNVDGQSVPCSRTPVRSLRTPFVPPGGQVAAGDLFSCLRTDGGIECWGASRDGFFGDPRACPEELRRAWPTLGGTVTAPAAACSVMPAAVPGFADVKRNWMVVPRGLCATDDQGLRCVGGIPTPRDRHIDGVALGPGRFANACGVRADQVLCWGEGYSSPSTPDLPVPVTFEPVASGDVAIVGNPKRRACSPIAPALAPCPAGTTGRPWAEILPAAASSAGKIVTVRGPLGVGPLLQVNESSEDDPFDYDSDPRAVRFHADLLLDGASQPLVLWGLGCEGDGSGACCDAPAYGETVVVTGRLVAGPLRAGGVFDWHLYATAACAAAPGQTP